MMTGSARQPQQDRGIRRVARLLDAAEEEILRNGVDGLTMNAVARRAATAPGSLYQFFPGKPALLAALSHRHETALTMLAGEVAARLAAAPERTIRATATAFLRPFIAYYQEHPAYLVLAEAANRSGPGAVPKVTSDQAVASALANCLTPLVRADVRPRLDVAAELMVAVSHAAISAGMSLDGSARDAWLAELEHLLAAYVGSLA
jgi:AcrR family transcriptional regulator